jgi:hypothetical protein
VKCSRVNVKVYLYLYLKGKPLPLSENISHAFLISLIWNIPGKILKKNLPPGERRNRWWNDIPKLFSPPSFQGLGQTPVPRLNALVSPSHSFRLSLWVHWALCGRVTSPSHNRLTSGAGFSVGVFLPLVDSPSFGALGSRPHPLPSAATTTALPGDHAAHSTFWGVEVRFADRAGTC